MVRWWLYKSRIVTWWLYKSRVLTWWLYKSTDMGLAHHGECPAHNSRVGSLNPTRGSWCVTLSKWLYPLMLKAGGLVAIQLWSSVLTIYGAGTLKTLANHSKRVGHCVPVVRFLPWIIHVTDIADSADVTLNNILIQ